MLHSEKTTLAQSGGRGKRAVTILTESGWHYPVISDQTRIDRARAQTAPFVTGRGARPMHRTTFMMSKPPWDPQTGFSTTNKSYFGDIGLLKSTQRPSKCRSMHNQHFTVGDKHTEMDNWYSQYNWEHKKKDLIPAHQLHKVALVNRTDQTEGGEMKQTIHTDTTEPSYWTQYKRTHDKLGFLLGPGKQRSYPVKQQFNPFTGEVLGPVWKEDNRRISGNRLLHELRQKPENKILLN